MVIRIFPVLIEIGHRKKDGHFEGRRFFRFFLSKGIQAEPLRRGDETGNEVVLLVSVYPQIGFGFFNRYESRHCHALHLLLK